MCTSFRMASDFHLKEVIVRIYKSLFTVTTLQSRESKRKFTELEGKLREDLLMAKIRDTENSQCVAELTQKISNLEFKVLEKNPS